MAGQVERLANGAIFAIGKFRLLRSVVLVVTGLTEEERLGLTYFECLDE